MHTKARMVLALAAMLALPACSGLGTRTQPPSVTVSDVRMGTASVMEQQYFVKLRVQNPNDTEWKVNGVSFTLDLNGQPFAKGVGGEAVTVPRFGSAVMEVEAISGLSGILRQLSSLQGGKAAQGISYHIKGRLVTRNAGSLPFEDSGEFRPGAAAPAQ